MSQQMIVGCGEVPGHKDGHMPSIQINGDNLKKKREIKREGNWGIKFIEDDNTPYTCAPYPSVIEFHQPIVILVAPPPSKKKSTIEKKKDTMPPP